MTNSSLNLPFTLEMGQSQRTCVSNTHQHVCFCFLLQLTREYFGQSELLVPAKKGELVNVKITIALTQIFAVTPERLANLA